METRKTSMKASKASVLLPEGPERAYENLWKGKANESGEWIITWIL